MKIGVILLAAGSGSRFGGNLPKQYVPVCGKPIVLHALEYLAAEPRIAAVQPVVAEGDVQFSQLVAGMVFPFTLMSPVSGGPARSISMWHGLQALPENIDMVAVHDAARPVPSKQLLADVFDMAERFGAAVPGVAVTDTIKRINSEGMVLETPERHSLRAVQTPQVARRDWFEQAIASESERLHCHTDDASLLEAAGFPVYVSQGNVHNRKVTNAEDVVWLEKLLGGEQ